MSNIRKNILYYKGLEESSDSSDVNNTEIESNNSENENNNEENWSESWTKAD